MSGYAIGTPQVRRCPTCNGTGINPVATYLLCPKCNGEKWVAPVSPVKPKARW